MANYKTHLSVGIILGIIGCLASFVFLLKTDISSGFFIILFVVLGSILPDLDSDDSTPFKIVFWFFSLISGIGGFYILQNNGSLLIYQNLLIAFLIMIIIRYGAGGVFKKFTRHRGIFHSVPVAIIFSLIIFLLLDKINLDLDRKIIFSLALLVGYIFHLILDEIYSGINFKGVLFKPKKSLGSALKMFSNSAIVNAVTYAFLILLLFLVDYKDLFQEIKKLFNQ